MRAGVWLLIFAGGCIPRLHTSGGGGDTTTPSTTDSGAVVNGWTAPDNSWIEGDDPGPPPTLMGEGFDDGEVALDVWLPDQNGETVSLWQFYGDVIVFDVSTVWCDPCKELAASAQATVDSYAPQGFHYVTVLQQNVEGAPAQVSDAELWSSSFGIDNPVLADGEDPPATAAATPGNQFPTVILIGRDMKVIDHIFPTDDATVRAAVESAL